MAYRLNSRSTGAQKRLNLGLLLLSCLGASSLQADSISDMLIVLDPNGRHYIAQQWLATSDNPAMMELPAARTPLETTFAGPEQQEFTTAHTQNPQQLALSSGSVMTRYQHQYEQGMSEPYPGVFELDTTLEHGNIQFDRTDEVQWSLTWVLPGNVSLLQFDADSTGEWQNQGQIVTYRQTGGDFPALRLRFSLAPFESLVTEPCLPGSTTDERCAPDIDNDGVPDLRDLCLPATSAIVSLLPPAALTLQTATPAPLPETPDELGCAHEDPQLLTGVRFASGQSYLDVASRTVLERVARALQKYPDQRFEIRSHTDNAGRVDINLRLSRERAVAVRHYLQLQGVEPTQLKVRGLGESAPVYDNAVAAGRRANRRIELYRLD